LDITLLLLLSGHIAFAFAHIAFAFAHSAFAFANIAIGLRNQYQCHQCLKNLTLLIGSNKQKQGSHDFDINFGLANQ
jgi:hypothetical protein